MKTGKIYKSLIILGFPLIMAPCMAVAQQAGAQGRTTFVSESTLQWIVIVLLITVFVILMMLIVQGIGKNKAISRLNRRIDVIVNLQNSENQMQLRPQVSSSLPRYNEVADEKLKNQLNELTGKLEELNKKVDANQTKSMQINSLDKSNADEIQSADLVLEAVVPQDQDTLSEPITLSIPQQQEFVSNCMTAGAFQELLPINKKSRHTPYIISKRENEYYFRLDESNLDAITTAIQYRNSYIDGFCESLNNHFPGAKSFTQESKAGRLQWEGETLQVVEKIKIRYS
ncbi:hypothetical protein [Sphingobacterium multivorum]|uniref:hypothetical protein n=1 Tax=Sphingobacterium multivorum TaxID=28454 RepID=UPI0028ACA848|nr:hypothetical protein [Sphingobacterium multivorum]